MENLTKSETRYDIRQHDGVAIRYYQGSGLPRFL